MQIQPASKALKKLRIALFGDSGNGKTHTALLMAQALGARILVIDSEDGASHNFSDLTAFSVLKIEAPTIESYMSALDIAIKNAKDFDVVVIDSLSHAWQDALKKVNGYNNTTLGWGKVTPLWDGLIHKIKQLPQHAVVTIRAKKRQDSDQNNSWQTTWDARENADYDFDLMLKMIGVRQSDGTTVAKAIITKNRFNTDNAKIKVGGEVNAGASLIKFILDWQRNEVKGQEGANANDKTPA